MLCLLLFIDHVYVITSCNGKNKHHTNTNTLNAHLK